MVAHPVPSLDGSSFITDPHLKIDAILANYAATQYSQSVIYRNIISSFSKDIQQCAQQWDKLPDSMQRSLDRLFTAYFDQCDVQVDLDQDSMDADNASFKITVVGSVTQDGVAYEIGKVLQITNTQFSSVTDFSLGNAQYD